MKGQIATGFLPYEIGDTILLKQDDCPYVITDIRMIQYIKERKVEFEVLVEGVWISAKLIEKRIT